MSVSNYKRKLNSEPLSSNDTSWEYTLPDIPNVPDSIPCESDTFLELKLLTFDDDGITLSFEKRKLNRILTLDYPSKFCAVSFANFKLSGRASSNETADYIEKFLTTGIKLNNIVYTCFGWSNSQLKSRSCLLYAFPPGKTASGVLKTLGNFDDILTVGKKAKRIGLLFTEAELGLTLSEDQFQDIPDVERDGQVFTDGCGLMSNKFAKRISRIRKRLFHGHKYMPSVIQIRYRGYKGVLMINPSPMQKDVLFRKSMRKFTGSSNNTFAVKAYSKPYTFGKLNAELVTLLSVLGVPDDIFLRKQREYFDMISQAGDDPLKAFIFLSYMGDQDSAESIVLNGLQSARRQLKEAQHTAWAKMFDKRDSEKVHFLVPQSRIIFGVADPTEKLWPNECHVRITIEGAGVRSLDGAWIIVGRNPCLHPGDIRKLRVKELPELQNVIDCIVFSVNGKTPPPSMMSGGDLDGDQFFVCWDPELIPVKVHEPYHYPPAKERPKNTISHHDLIRHFAGYNNASLGRVKNLYLDWVSASEQGAASGECQQLNHLFSCCVDGERISIPEHLLKPPERKQPEPFILKRLTQQVTAEHRQIHFGLREGMDNLDIDMIELLAAADDICLDEFELFQLIYRWCSLHNTSISRFMNHFDFGSFTAEQKAWVRANIEADVSIGLDSVLQNALLQSRILGPSDLKQYSLARADVHWRRLYSSEIDGSSLFLKQLAVGLEDFVHKLLVIDVQERLKIALLIAGRISPIDVGETLVDQSVVAFAFRPQNETTGRRTMTRTGYRLVWDGVVFQLFNNVRRDTFVFFKKAETPAHGDIGRLSIALNRFGAILARNVGRVNREPMRNVEIYVISNRDRIGHQILSLSDNNVPTQELIPRIVNVPREYQLEDIQQSDWALYPSIVSQVLKEEHWSLLDEANANELAEVESLSCKYQSVSCVVKLAEWYFRHHEQHDLASRLSILLASVPRLCVLIKEIAAKRRNQSVWAEVLRSGPLVKAYIIALIQSANYVGGLVIATLTTFLYDTKLLQFDDIAHLMSIVPTTIRSPLLALEVITVLHDYAIRRNAVTKEFEAESEVEVLARMLRNVCIDRCAEAQEACECNDWGIPLAEDSECMLSSLENIDARLVKGNPRLDLKFSFRVGDHVRLRPASQPNNAPLHRPRILDGQIISARQGTVMIKLMEPAPIEKCSWFVLRAGNTTTTNAMTDAIRKLAKQRQICCALYPMLVPGLHSSTDSQQTHLAPVNHPNLNASQLRAVTAACEFKITLAWGPPGTGKTTTIVAIIKQWEHMCQEDDVILVAASTNNAVDNVLEKYVLQSSVEAPSIVRVSPDSSELSKTGQRYWVGAFVEGDINESKPAMREAQRKIKEAKIIFTTCTGAGLGLLRKSSFAYVVIDEASQLTEPNCLIPLVKNCQRAVLVGDHVQLHPNVTQLGAVYEFNVSLFERLYLQSENIGVAKIMLNSQYRMHPEIATFPSRHFYEGKLLTGVSASDRTLNASNFDWRGKPVLFVPAGGPPDGQESLSGRDGSKCNNLQAKICKDIVDRLQHQPATLNLQDNTSKSQNASGQVTKHSIAVLTPYAAQVKLLKSLEKHVESKTVSSVTVATIDSFQGREADIVVFCTVRCNLHNSIGFLADERRMNVALTRAKRGLIVVGNKQTLVGSSDGGAFWKAWFRWVNGSLRL